MTWQRVTKFDQRARALADRHYSRQSIGNKQFMPPGVTLVLLDASELAVWGVCENLFKGATRWRVTIFRNEGGGLSSDLIREATKLTYERWLERGALPAAPLTTEIDARKVKRKRDPGRCFLRAGWTRDGFTKRYGFVRLRAPSHEAAHAA